MPHHSPGRHQLPGHRTIFGRRRGIAARVIVHQNDTGSGLGNGSPEHLTRVHQGAVEQPSGDQDVPQDPASGVERQQVEFLVKGLKWAVKRFEEALPTLTPEARETFTRMRDSHLRSIAACESLLRALPG